MRAGHRAALPPPEPDPTDTGLSFDPAVHTETEVIEYVKHNPAQCKEVYNAEQAGRARSRLLQNLATLCWPEGQSPPPAPAQPDVDEEEAAG